MTPTTANGFDSGKRTNRKSGSRYRQVPAAGTETYQNTRFGAGYTDPNNSPFHYESQGRVAAPFDTPDGPLR